MPLDTSAITCELVLVFSAWMTLNLALNYYNKYVLSHTGFHFPFMLTVGNKVVGFFVATIVMSIKSGLPKPEVICEQIKRPIVHAQGVFTALNIGLNNWSLVFITLTLNQVLKATVPLPTALLSVVFEKKSFGWQLYGSMLVLVVGCVLAACGTFGQEPVGGIIICIGSVLATAGWTVTSAMAMQLGEKPLDAVSLIFVSGPTCIATLLIFFFSIELPRLISGNTGSADGRAMPSAGMMALYLSIAALLASVYDIVHNQFVKLTSSMNMAIMGNSKLALLVVLSMATLESPPTPVRIVGVCVALVGVVWYAVFKLNEQAPKPKPDVEKGEGKEATGTGGDDKTQPLASKDATEASALLKK